MNKERDEFLYGIAAAIKIMILKKQEVSLSDFHSYIAPHERKLFVDYLSLTYQEKNYVDIIIEDCDLTFERAVSHVKKGELK